MIYCPSIHDRHQDHRNTAQNVLVAGRKVDSIFAYESISALNTFNPTMYVDITDTEKVKEQALNMHKSQAHRYYMPNDGLDVIHKYHGLKIGYPERSFEAFEVIKLIK
jgi:LmbE family N-acetylglucosaminyl deacetylase